MSAIAEGAFGQNTTEEEGEKVRQSWPFNPNAPRPEPPKDQVNLDPLLKEYHRVKVTVTPPIPGVSTEELEESVNEEWTPQELEQIITELEDEVDSGEQPYYHMKHPSVTPKDPDPEAIENLAEKTKELEKYAEEVKEKVDKESPTDISNKIGSMIPSFPQNIKTGVLEKQSKNMEETKKLMTNFRDQLNENFNDKKPFLSYEGSTLLLVLLALKKEQARCSLKNLPEDDRAVVTAVTKDLTVNTAHFDVRLNKNNNFELYFDSLKSGTDRKVVVFVNAVANPRLEDLKDAKDALKKDSVDVDDKGDKIELPGGLEIDKRLAKRIIYWNKSGYGVPSDEEFCRPRSRPVASMPISEPKEMAPQPSPILNSVNKNAYEIRTDVLAMALDFIKDREDTNLTSDDVLSTAQKFYKFVENRR